MGYSTRSYIVNNVTLPISASHKEAFAIATKKLASVGVRIAGCECSIYKRSVDARKKNDIKFVYSVMVSGELPELSEDKLRKVNAVSYTYVAPEFTKGDEKLDSSVVVVGSGPCGLFAALLLAENGYKTVLIERGGSIAERNKQVEAFKKTRILDTNTNIQFGAGGAGTFSDGKLVTRVNDSMSTYVLTRFVEFGAPEEILYLAKPHIGTDILSTVVDRMLNRIEELGGKVLYHTEFKDYKLSGNKITGIYTNNGVIDCSALVLAIGHSARDTYGTLIERGFDIVPKAFSVGMRIEHSTEIIDRGMYGDFAFDPRLAHAEYNLSYNTKERGVYTFCMCPGGTVVAATSENGGVVVNGMSAHARDGKNSNSAVCCSIFKEDYGSNPKAAIEFQRRIERAAFVAGGSNYSAPIITVGDFLSGKCSTEPTDIFPTYMDGQGVRLADPSLYLPEKVVDLLRRGIVDFDRKINGFAHPTAVLTGAETRTSAPLRIMRDNTTRLATGYNNLYPAGEGAGYAGGITSAAIDGIHTAIAIINRFKP